MAARNNRAKATATRLHRLPQPRIINSIHLSPLLSSTFMHFCMDSDSSSHLLGLPVFRHLMTVSACQLLHSIHCISSSTSFSLSLPHFHSAFSIQHLIAVSSFRSPFLFSVSTCICIFACSTISFSLICSRAFLHSLTRQWRFPIPASQVLPFSPKPHPVIFSFHVFPTKFLLHHFKTFCLPDLLK